MSANITIYSKYQSGEKGKLADFWRKNHKNGEKRASLSPILKSLTLSFNETELQRIS